MFSLSALVFTGLIGLLAGAGLGAFLLYLFRAQVYSRDLESRLHEAENALQTYQHDVAEHFAQTSQLVNNLTQSYRDVHEHLANSAMKLATPAISRQILESANTSLLDVERTYINEQNFEPPRDWAPKTGDEKGALSEEFGLREDTLDEHRSPPTESPEEYDFDDKQRRF